MSQNDGAYPPGGSVPPEPVVRIVVDPLSGFVSVNGVAIEHDGSASLHQVAVHAAARQVAQVLHRPVRAVAYVAGARSRMVIHPDGRTTDVEVDVAAFPPVPPTPGAAGRAHRAAHRRRFPLRHAVALVSVAGLVLAAWVAGAAGLAYVSGPTATSPPVPAGPAPVEEAGPPVEAVPEFRLRAASTIHPARRLEVSVTGQEKALVAVVTATHLPVTVRIVVQGPAGGSLVREVRIRRQAQRVVLRDLRPGAHRWTASALDAAPVTGSATVPPPLPAPDPADTSPTAQPGGSTAPPPAPPPSPAPAPAPAPKPPPTPKGEPPPQPDEG